MIPGAPLLGATETVKGTLSGLTFGLPISEVVTYSFHIFVFYYIITNEVLQDVRYQLFSLFHLIM